MLIPETHPKQPEPEISNGGFQTLESLTIASCQLASRGRVIYRGTGCALSGVLRSVLGGYFERNETGAATYITTKAGRLIKVETHPRAGERARTHLEIELGTRARARSKYTLASARSGIAAVIISDKLCATYADKAQRSAQPEAEARNICDPK